MGKWWALCVQLAGCSKSLHPPFLGGLVHQTEAFSSMAFGLGSATSLKCLLNISCKHQRGPDLAASVTSWYALGQVLNIYCDTHVTSAIKCTVGW